MWELLSMPRSDCCDAAPRRRRLLIWFLVPLLLGLGGPSATSEEQPEAPEIADRVLAALEAKDAKTFASLAALDDPDPWLVADRLLELGNHDAALRFAEATERPATQGLVEYVQGRKGLSAAKGSREAVLAARKALEKGNWAAMEKAVADIPTEDESAVTAQVLFARGIAEGQQGKFADASRTMAVAVTVARRIGWLNMESYALDWANGMALRNRERFRAVQYASQRVALETRWGRKKELHDAYVDLAEALTAASDLEGAVEAYESAVVQAKVLGEPARLAQTLGALAKLHVSRHAWHDALTCARRSYDAADEADSATGRVIGLASIGTVYSALGELDRADVFLHRAIELAEKEGMHGHVAGVTARLGSLYARRGAYAKALTAFEQALTQLQKSDPGGDLGPALTNSAVLQEKLGNRTLARRHLRAALKLFDAKGNARAISSVASSLAELEIHDGRYDEADALLKRALEAARSVNAARVEGSAYASMGTLANRRGDHKRAAELYRRALGLFKKTHSADVIPMTEANLGRALMNLGQHKEGLALMEAAHASALHARDVPRTLDIASLLAQAHLAAGNPERALQYTEASIRQMPLVLGGLGERVGINLRGELREFFVMGAEAAHALKKPRVLLRYFEAGRAGSLLESLGGREALGWTDIDENLVREEREARKDQADAAAKLRRAHRRGDRARIKVAEAEEQQATRRLMTAIDRIQRDAKAKARLHYPLPADAARIRGVLEPNEACVVYGHTQTKAVAVVLTKETIRHVTLHRSDGLSAALATFKSPGEEADLTAAAETLRKALVEPLALPKAVTQVVVSPVGTLDYLPMAMIFGRPTAMLPSASTLAYLRTGAPRRGTQVLAVGDPKYDTQRRVLAAATRSGVFAPLPATRVEVNKVGTVKLLGDEANESALRTALATRKRWRSVHFACHGVVHRDRPGLSALALTPSAEDNGMLTVLEVFRMNISTDLAVLSACETGQGHHLKGEGMVGLASAFMHAGAERVLASLWKVDDEATRALMVKFYELWNGPKPMSAADALAGAQAHVKAQKKWSHPYYWAAWVLWGRPE